MRDYAQTALVDASGDRAKIRALLIDEVAIAGLHFTDPACLQFSGLRIIKGDAQLDSLATCLASMKWQASPRSHMVGDMTVVTHGDFELEGRIVNAINSLKPRLVKLGFATRRQSEFAPTITEDAIEKLRTGGERRPVLAGLPPDSGAWFRICVDAAGVTTSYPLLASSPDALRVYASAVASWSFSPYQLDGKAIAACAAFELSDPRSTRERLPPSVPKSRSGRDAPVFAVGYEAAKRVSGKTRLVPWDKTKTAIMKSGVHAITSTFRLCLDEAGAAESVDIINSTGFTEYDVVIVDGMKTWVYQPVVVDGAVSPFCTYVNFHYTQR